MGNAFAFRADFPDLSICFAENFATICAFDYFQNIASLGYAYSSSNMLSSVVIVNTSMTLSGRAIENKNKNCQYQYCGDKYIRHPVRDFFIINSPPIDYLFLYMSFVHPAQLRRLSMEGVGVQSLHEPVVTHRITCTVFLGVSVGFIWHTPPRIVVVVPCHAYI
jgi:hypothetical protein